MRLPFPCARRTLGAPRAAARGTPPKPRGWLARHLTGSRPIASFLVVSDPVPERRLAFAARAASRLGPAAGLRVGRVDAGAVTIVWEAFAGAPVSTLQTPSAAAVVWGDALTDGGSRADAATVARAWTERGADPAVYDGFYAAAVAHESGVAVGADVLGLFPVYYAACGEVLLVGSSSAAFGAHPLFRDELDLAALLGHLLTGGPFDGRTLVHGVRRLAAGRLLQWAGRGEPREEPHFDLPDAGGLARLSSAEQLERYDAVLGGAVRRHVGAHPSVSLLLSGGRDSRMLAGYLAEVRRPFDALTLGVPSDYEASCAARVARTLGVPSRLHAVPFEAFPGYADRSVRWEQLAGGMSSVHTWGTVDELHGTGRALLSGYLLEFRQTKRLPPSRDGMLAWTHARALAPARLRALLQSDAARDAVDGVLQAAAACYDGTTPDVAERSWRWFAAVYARFHAGGVPWRLSLASWPVLPILDRAVLGTMLALPVESMADRRLQDTLLRRRFPQLARLPLDRNTHDVRPLSPSAGWRVREAAARALAPLARRDAAVERRYYARVYDFDNPGWQAIRRAAEPGRGLVAEWFDPARLEALVPPPGRAAAHGDPIGDGFAPKMLAGFMRWCALRETGPT